VRSRKSKVIRMGTLQKVVKLNQLHSDNPGLVDGVSGRFVFAECFSIMLV